MGWPGEGFAVQSAKPIEQAEGQEQQDVGDGIVRGRAGSGELNWSGVAPTGYIANAHGRQEIIREGYPQQDEMLQAYRRLTRDRVTSTRA